jgi:hypothetical protein
LLSPEIQRFLLDRGFSCLGDWGDSADVKRQVIYSARIGRGIADVHVQNLARVASVDARTVRALLEPAHRRIREVSP